MSDTENDNNISSNLPDEFTKVIKDFIRDLLVTFPEYKDKLNQGILDIVLDKETDEANSVFTHCKNVFPSQFFNILYEKEELLTDEKQKKETEFLPGIIFHDLWKCNISEKTRETIWKYLQLISFTTIKYVSNEESFGDTAKLFEAINENEFREKLEQTVSDMQNIFDVSNNNMDMSGVNLEDLPTAESLNDHISGMLNGKLGRLAQEIAEETARDMNIDENVTTMEDVFNKLFKNPTKLMGLVKNVGDKLDKKMKSGEIKESELISEAQEMVEKMKNMPGMKNMETMLKKMGMDMGNMKMNSNAMKSHLNKNFQQAKTKERMLEKLKKRQEEQRRKQEELLRQQQENKEMPTDQKKISVYSTGETTEKTKRNNNKKKKRNKKKKKG